MNDNSMSIDQSTAPMSGKQLGIGLLLLMVLWPIVYAIGGEAQSIAIAGLQVLPFMFLAVCAYLGLRFTWGKVLTLVYWVIFIGISALGIFAMSISPFVDLNNNTIVSGGLLSISQIFLSITLAFFISLVGFIPPFQRWLSRFLPFDPNSFVHRIALVTMLTLSLISFAPLLFQDAPPLLALFEQNSETFNEGRDDSGMLRDMLYGLMWTVPCAIVAVGYGLQRDLPAALERLGLVRPTLRQLGEAAVFTVVLVIVATLLNMSTSWLWGIFGWPTTDGEAFNTLLGFAINPIGAVVIGVTAGLGEELAIRGALQPRFGILLPNIFFTSLHAMQYHWDSLLLVFLIGLALGWIRKRSNTTISAIVHGSYNFILVLGAALQIPWFS